ncbi:MAG TPA: NADH-quinone oxidoreductase subunit H, partial [Chloroflexota bacterium]|nr:NADH-quinone oxidoreductase subunit H [Chloroflexota bacterium]
LYLLAASSLGVYGLVLGGWSSGSKYSLLGGLRAAAQVVSYELILGLSLVGVVIVSGSLSLRQIVEAQARSVPYILVQPLGFLLYLVAAVAEVNRAPFDLPEADTELVAGYHTEYSGMRFAMFYIGEYVSMISVSALAATMFFGGWWGPVFPGPHWLFVKMVLFLFMFVWLRATLPRLRYDQLMRLSWSILLPLGLLNVAVTALAVAIIG